MFFFCSSKVKVKKIPSITPKYTEITKEMD
jgi:hypothetical protein